MPLVYVFCVCSLLFCSLNPMLSKSTSLIDKIDPTSEDVEMVKKNLINYNWVTYFCEM